MKARTIYVDEIAWNDAKKRAKEAFGLNMSKYVDMLIRLPVTLHVPESEMDITKKHLHIIRGSAKVKKKAK